MKRICIVDYGMGNLRSVQKAFEYLGFNPIVTSNKDEVEMCEAIVLPGVGAFDVAYENLEKLDLVDVLKRKLNDAIFLGICLGYQLLYEFSEEGNCEGLKVLEGKVKKFPKKDTIKIPHMGWNKIKVKNSSKLLKGLDGQYVYFVHSYYVDNKDKEIVSSTCEHGIEFDSSIEKGNIFATQFHPEKSGEVGLEILRNFGGLI
ncbi:imidazole glycerol phosphate synthase subunit HisH [Caldicellulosiruptor changbaiensis]|uniref:Imidazole glycerol phosphate synthase subunit HisH n=1 Tax=Caldicellulosiruptor changbaiensis TaxID=1222016 RepID=A0A3T0D5C4_9FIRM|nr:imidazole glycerol phosphate synthase subunit HisH [Caldicellulosiruptor changbaiensis]AZT90234.1 imidazole glycerol phosphate synthase subunit HisH [Caldicellulosiruptor changbaiensis]